MKAIEWLEKVKTERGIQSDYALAKQIGLTRAAVSKHRTTASTLDEKASIAVAEALGIAPAGVILDQMAERVKSASVRTTLLDQARRLCILC